MAQNTNDATLTFLGMPAEIRCEIYKELFSTATRKEMAGLALANKQIKDEFDYEFFQDLKRQIRAFNAEYGGLREQGKQGPERYFCVTITEPKEQATTYDLGVKVHNWAYPMAVANTLSSARKQSETWAHVPWNPTNRTYDVEMKQYIRDVLISLLQLKVESLTLRVDAYTSNDWKQLKPFCKLAETNPDQTEALMASLDSALHKLMWDEPDAYKQREIERYDHMCKCRPDSEKQPGNWVVVRRRRARQGEATHCGCSEPGTLPCECCKPGASLVHPNRIMIEFSDPRRAKTRWEDEATANPGTCWDYKYAVPFYSESDGDYDDWCYEHEFDPPMCVYTKKSEWRK